VGRGAEGEGGAAGVGESGVRYFVDTFICWEVVSCNVGGWGIGLGNWAGELGWVYPWEVAFVVCVYVSDFYIYEFSRPCSVSDEAVYYMICDLRV